MRQILSLLLVSAALPAMAEVPRVVTDLPPVQSLVAQVMGALGQPDLLLERGANAHSFQLRPSQAASLQAADLVVWIGPEMTPWLERALQGSTTAPALRLLQAEGTFRQSFGATLAHDHGTAPGEEGHDEATAEDGTDEPAQEQTGADHGGPDPHAWLDPANAAHWLGLIAAELSRLDPDNAATYGANADKARADLATLDAELATLLAPSRDKPLVVFHDAYGYFAGHYGLTIAATITMGDAAAPGARHIAKIETLLRSGPVCLFPEAGHDPGLVVQLAEASGLVPAAALDPMGAMEDPGPGLYATLMRQLARGIAACAADQG